MNEQQRIAMQLLEAIRSGNFPVPQSPPVVVSIEAIQTRKEVQSQTTDKWLSNYGQHLPKEQKEMPNINDMKSSNSRFLTQKDVGKGVLVTVSSVEMDNVAPEGAAPDEKWIVHFSEQEKPMVLNNTNLELMALATGEDDSDEWKGKSVVVFTDPTVMYGGRRTGGLRIRAPKPGTVKPEPQEDPDDDIPF